MIIAPWKRTLFGITAILGWFGLLFQFYIIFIHAQADGRSLLWSLVQYFTYFTILTNLPIAVDLSLRCLQPRSSWSLFFTSRRWQGAMVVYIIVVSLIYNLLLKHLWHPEGLNYLADRCLHNAVPVLFVIFWLSFFRRGDLRWKDSFVWLIWPVIYFVYVMIRGSLTGIYPYGFLNADQMGFLHVLMIALVILLIFWLLGLLVVGVDRFLKRFPR